MKNFENQPTFWTKPLKPIDCLQIIDFNYFDNTCFENSSIDVFTDEKLGRIKKDVWRCCERTFKGKDHKM